MTTLYNRLAGQGIERLAALSDGIFAFAMTLLVLDIHVPDLPAVHGEAELWSALVALAPRLVMWLMSFMTLGIFWIGQQSQLNHFERSDRDLTWIHILFLASTTLLPFTTALLAAYITYRTALLIYWVNVLSEGAILFASWAYARRNGLLKPDVPPDIDRAIYGRIVIAQALYAAGAALCLINTYWSIGFIVLVQLNYAIAPRLRRRA
jgi:uncharacterized membrane protein